MLLHEALHIKRKDIWVRGLSLAALVLHWFNPLVHIMNRYIRTEAESACDADVLRYAGNEARQAYGQTVFDAAKRTGRFMLPVSVLASTLSGEGKNLKRRLRDIIERKHTRRALAVSCAVLMIGGVLLAGMLSYGRREEPGVPEGGFTEEIGWLGDGEDAGPEPLDLLAMEAAGRLVIYLPAANEMGHRMIRNAIFLFRGRYPDVEVVVETIGDRDDWGNEAYRQRVGTEMMAGLGPDILLTHLFDDLQRAMEAGLFMNLSPFWHRDPDFAAREELNHGVMDAGLFRGRRYVVPISYNPPIHFSERGALEQLGFDFGAGHDAVSFMNAVGAVLPTAALNPNFSSRPLMGFSHLPFSGAPLVDFERSLVLPFQSETRALHEAFGSIYDDDWWGPLTHFDIMQNQGLYTWISDGRVLFGDYYYKATDALFTLGRMKTLEQEIYLFALQNHQNEVAVNVEHGLAVNANSPNYINAWRFIRLMLTETRQYARIGGLESHGLGGGLPVNNIARDRAINEFANPAGFTAGTSAGNVWIPPLSAEDKSPLTDVLGQISAATLPNRVLEQFVYEIMTPYWQGETDLDTAMEALERRLRFYMAE
jgi:ABC-type glycerol-3-phosphate transport system substrate-binding protein